MKAALAFLLLSLVAAGPAASQCMGNASATQRGVLKAQKPVLLLGSISRPGGCRHGNGFIRPFDAARARSGTLGAL